MTASSSQPRARVRLLALLLLTVLVPLILITLLEGASSFVLVFLAFGRGEQNQQFRGRLHTRYDPELGWENAPDISIPDMYGPKVSVRIDAQGFRVTGTRPASPRVRVVCSGDSFTFGVGVADDRAWCALLGRLDSSIATVNMGQTGYGLDQAYLWYKRDGLGLPHDVHILAYITNDFRRMMGSSSWGFGKPLLAVQGDTLVVENTPVPDSPGAARRYWSAVLLRNELHLAQLLLWVRDSVFQGHGVQQGSLSGEWTEEDRATWVKVKHVVDDLVRINRMKGSTLVLIHLPVLEDYWVPQSDPWRDHVKAAASGGDFVFVDLVQELRRLPADSATQMFIGPGVPGYLSGGGHYTVEGNWWVATQIHRRLLALPGVAAKLRPVR